MNAQLQPIAQVIDRIDIGKYSCNPSLCPEPNENFVLTQTKVDYLVKEGYGNAIWWKSYMYRISQGECVVGITPDKKKALENIGLIVKELGEG